MASLPTPVLDNHLHLNPDGRGVEAVEAFARAGGTHLLVVNLPSWHIVDDPTEPTAFETTFDATKALVEAATGVLPGRAWAVLGVHPALISRLVDDRGWPVERAQSHMATGLHLAADYVGDGRALALKSGRPHYDVSDEVWSASNELIAVAAGLASDRDCALQLHTEDTDDLEEVAKLARDDGLEPTRVVKHFATGPVQGVTPSVIARRDAIRATVTGADRYLFETDYLDDPDRPGAVLGPKVVPRRSRTLAEDGALDVLVAAHIDTPRDVYGIDTESTLER